MSSLQPSRVPLRYDDGIATSPSHPNSRGRLHKPRRRSTIAVILAVMLALFGGFVTVQNVANAAVANSGAVPDHAKESGNKWAGDTWHAAAVPGVGVWPQGAIDVATVVDVDPATGAATRALRGIFGGAPYADRDRQLTNFILANSPPGCTADPTKLVMHEYDVNDRPWGGARDGERIVHVTGGCVAAYDFYTADHYQNFTTFTTY